MKITFTKKEIAEAVAAYAKTKFKEYVFDESDVKLTTEYIGHDGVNYNDEYLRAEIVVDDH